MNAKTLYNEIKQRLQDMQVHDPAYEARCLLEDILSIQWMDIIAGSDVDVPDEAFKKCDAILDERATGKPLTRILGVREFWGLNFTLNDDTLDPRPETEILVEKALSFITEAGLLAPNILDLGTGTGCIPITLLHEKKSAHATAVDLSAKALEAAMYNAKYHGVDDRLTCVQSNWCDNVQGQFDVLVSNPPYIDTSDITNLSREVKNHDPILALDGGENGVAPYEIIFSQIKNVLKPAGRAFLEIGQGQCGYIQGIAEKYRIRILNIYPDYAGIPRVVEISCGDK